MRIWKVKRSERVRRKFMFQVCKILQLSLRRWLLWDSPGASANKLELGQLGQLSEKFGSRQSWPVKFISPSILHFFENFFSNLNFFRSSSGLQEFRYARVKESWEIHFFDKPVTSMGSLMDNFLSLMSQKALESRQAKVLCSCVKMCVVFSGWGNYLTVTKCGESGFFTYVSVNVYRYISKKHSRFGYLA